VLPLSVPSILCFLSAKKKKGRRRFPHKENEGTKFREAVFLLSAPSILCFLSAKKKKGRRRFSHKENEGTKVGEEKPEYHFS
jgi:hypothetical protein